MNLLEKENQQLREIINRIIGIFEEKMPVLTNEIKRDLENIGK